MKKQKYFIDTILEKEKIRNQNMREIYEVRLLDLPKGSLVIRELKGRKYCYLRYREGKKVVLKYAGTEEQAEIVQAKIAERKHLTELIRMLGDERKRIMKMEAIR